ncbi:MAG: dipeptidase [Qingshengfaniella sp.]
MTQDLDQTATRIIRSTYVWDAHGGFMPDPLADLENLDLWRKNGFDYLSINAGFDCLSWTDAIRTISGFSHWIRANPDRYRLVETVKDIEQAQAAGQMAITFDLEGANTLNDDPGMVEVYHKLGVRQMLLTYNLNNSAAGGCHDDDHGLQPFGREVIDELNRLGMFVDLSHCGFRSTMDIIEHSPKPVIFSHANPRALWDHERNITDDQIQGCAETGGLAAVVGIGRFMNGDNSAARLVDGIVYMADLVGPEHVGIGLDYAFDVQCPNIEGLFDRMSHYWPASQGYGARPTHYVKPDQLHTITKEMLARGLSEDEVCGILGGNFLRLASQIWAR